MRVHAIQEQEDIVRLWHSSRTEWRRLAALLRPSRLRGIGYVVGELVRSFLEIHLQITHFHLDHAGALPWFLEKTAFRGRCFMTHATKAIYRMLISDYIRVSQYGGSDRVLYNEDDLEKSMDKIETIDYHEQKEINGVRICPYVAGHVLGAAMFMVEIAGVKVLYTGDFSREEDRHLCAAEIPAMRPDVLIMESTYGTQLHEAREQRERRFTTLVNDIVTRGGRCLIPAFALGRAQELLLILDEFWQKNPHLHEIPIYCRLLLLFSMMTLLLQTRVRWPRSA